jgi:hypothetical protein
MIEGQKQTHNLVGVAGVARVGLCDTREDWL